MRSWSPFLTASFLFLVLGCVSQTVVAAEKSEAHVPKFERDIRPILKAHCFHCHGEGTKAGLDLRLTRFMLKGGDSGPAIHTGKKGESLLFERISNGEMPPDDKPKLTPEQIRLIGAWIDAGAPTARPEPEKITAGSAITPEDREGWFFQPLRSPQIPSSQPAERARTSIDQFLAQRLREKHMSFSPDADKLTMIKRASFDLTGLPPTADEIETFLADQADDAYDRLLERLLNSPRYGERWGRHWLDVAGYADSDGYTDADSIRPWAFRYRDYVIRAFNSDKPMDQFILEQLAGDELLNGKTRNLSPDEQERLIATGFLRMGADGTATGGIDQDLARNAVMAETVKIVSSTFLGLTVGCAQCHDHRYDPILQADYYRLRAIFEPAYNWKNWRTPPERLISLYTDADIAKVTSINQRVNAMQEKFNGFQQGLLLAALEKELLKFPEALREPLQKAWETPEKNRTPEQVKLLDTHPSVKITAGVLYQYDAKGAEELTAQQAKIQKVAAERPAEEMIQALTERTGDPIPVTHLFHRGDHRQPKDPISPGILTICAPEGSSLDFPGKDPTLTSSGRRLALARWLVSRQNPLTARVLVNRIWMHHFGRGIVNTPSDFGTMGEKPTHAELLDWLANDFIANGWKVKRLHKLIMTSTAYRQISKRTDEMLQLDADDTLYGRMPVRRLEAEALRDRMLSVSGVLNPQMFGPPVPVKEDDVGQIVVGADPPPPVPAGPLPQNQNAFRRAIYIQVRRSQPLAMLQTFDAPVMQTNCERRQVSTVAPQSLLMMNSDFVLKQSGYLAQRVRRDIGDNPAAQAQRAWSLVFLRDPTPEEQKRNEEFLKKRVEFFKQPGLAAVPKDPSFEALSNLCQILLSANEFLYVD